MYTLTPRCRAVHTSPLSDSTVSAAADIVLLMLSGNPQVSLISELFLFPFLSSGHVLRSGQILHRRRCIKLYMMHVICTYIHFACGTFYVRAVRDVYMCFCSTVETRESVTVEGFSIMFSNAHNIQSGFCI